MTNPECCEKGKKHISWDGAWCLFPMSDAEHAKAWGSARFVVRVEIDFCPYCGTNLYYGKIKEKTLEQILEDIPAAPKEGYRLCFDVDGVLCDDSDIQKPYSERKAYPWASPILKKLKEKGYSIIIQTARYMFRCDGNQCKAKSKGFFELQCWLRANDIPYEEIYLGKASAKRYFDDRGCQINSNRGITDWAKALNGVN